MWSKAVLAAFSCWNNHCLAEGSGHGCDPAAERAGVGAVVGLPCCHGSSLSGVAAWLWPAARAVPFLLATKINIINILIGVRGMAKRPNGKCAVACAKRQVLGGANLGEFVVVAASWLACAGVC